MPGNTSLSIHWPDSPRCQRKSMSSPEKRGWKHLCTIIRNAVGHPDPRTDTFLRMSLSLSCSSLNNSCSKDRSQEFPKSKSIYFKTAAFYCQYFHPERKMCCCFELYIASKKGTPNTSHCLRLPGDAQRAGLSLHPGISEKRWK